MCYLKFKYMDFINAYHQKKQETTFASMTHATIRYKTNGLKMGHTTIKGFIQLEQETLVIAI